MSRTGDPENNPDDTCEFIDFPYQCCLGKVELRDSMTQYPFEGKKNSAEDPNRQFLACQAHYEEYVEHWKEMWAEYRSSQGF